MLTSYAQQTMVDTLPIPACVFTGENHIIGAANEHMLALWNKDASVIGSNLLDAIPEISNQGFFELLTEIYITGKPYNNPDGVASLMVNGELKTVYFDFSFKPIRDHDGNIYGVVNTAVDTTSKITALKELEQTVEELAATNEELSALNEEYLTLNEEIAVVNEEIKTSNEELANLNESYTESNQHLAESNEHLNNALQQITLAKQAAQLGTFDLDIINNILEWDDRCKELFGVPKDWAVTYLDDFVKGLYSDDRENVLKAVSDAYNQDLFGGKYDVEYRTVGQTTGAVCYVRAVGQVFFNENKEPVRFIGAVIDISDAIEKRNKIKVNEENLSLTIEAANLGIWNLGIASGELFLNERCKELYGLQDYKNVAIEDILARLDSEYIDAAQNALNNAIQHNQPCDITYQISIPETDERRWLRSVGRCYTDTLSKETRFYGVVQDITEQKSDEQRKNDFIGMVSHEMKTPVTSLLGYLQILDSKAKNNNDILSSNITTKALNQTRKITKMINGFLNVSRLEAGKIHIDRQVFDMADLVKEMEEEVISTNTTHNIIFAPVEPTPVNADRDKIGQVVTNLISNAVKYSPQGSTINVACITVNDMAVVSVKDAGMGVAEVDLNKLFDRYYRVENPNTKSISGFGIGLYLCKEIIERHQGTIAAKSELGTGSTFYFTLPVEN